MDGLQLAVLESARAIMNKASLNCKYCTYNSTRGCPGRQGTLGQESKSELRVQGTKYCTCTSNRAGERKFEVKQVSENCFICMSELPEVHGWMKAKRDGESLPSCDLVWEGGTWSPRCEWKKVFDPETRARCAEERKKGEEIQKRIRAKVEGKPDGYYLDSFEESLARFKARHPGWFQGVASEVSTQGNGHSVRQERLKEAVQNVEEVDWKLKASGESDEEEWDGKEDY